MNWNLDIFDLINGTLLDEVIHDNGARTTTFICSDTLLNYEFNICEGLPGGDAVIIIADPEHQRGTPLYEITIPAARLARCIAIPPNTHGIAIFPTPEATIPRFTFARREDGIISLSGGWSQPSL